MLPVEFENRMRNMLQEEYPAFLESYQTPPCHALRINSLKADPKDLTGRFPFLLPVPWAENGYYFESGFPFGLHPFHDAGVYYIQEPSAMAPAEYLDVRPNDTVLDLCGAPGGKSTQIAAKMKGAGLFISNEIHPARAKILSENIERMGICNSIVTNETPRRLAHFFPCYFDKILADAPCSGEGMFHKNELAITEWSLKNVALCANRQDEILDSAAKMLKPGGRMVYSTCTFAPEENEGTVSRFLNKHPEFELLPVEKKYGMAEGRRDWILDAAGQIERAVRLFPHKLKGEGHFFAVLHKKDIGLGEKLFREKKEKRKIKPDTAEWMNFCKENIKEMPKGQFLAFGDQMYLVPDAAPSLEGLKALRPGLHLGTNRKKRLEPSHALALFLHHAAVCRSMELDPKGDDIQSYLNGQPIAAEGEKGWHLITTGHYSIGWGKLSGGIMKNHYPKGLRKA